MIDHHPAGDFDGRTDARTIGGGEGISVRILPYGAIVQSILVPCPGGVRQVIANYASLPDYQADPAYVGCIIGRTANRIRGARFERGGQVFQLFANDGQNALHGGQTGFGRRVWQVRAHSKDRLVLERTSPEGEDGYPGRLTTEITFEVERARDLRISYKSWCDAPCPVDLTHHIYFNLGAANEDIAEHLIRVSSDFVLELDKDYIPTGHRLPVSNTPFDIRRPTMLSHTLSSSHPQLTSIGLNQAWILDGTYPALQLIAPDRRLELCLETDQPCLQLYSGLSHNVRFGGALAVEPHGFINAVNQSNFPSPWLEPGNIYERTSLYRFNTV